ncbi:unnamed protein product, partial [marine sediment metagenome]
MGIDGFTFFNRYPIQVKQSENIGRNIVDNFETALQRDKKDRGYIIALSFGKGAYEEVARVKKDGLFIELLTEPHSPIELAIIRESVIKELDRLSTVER